MSVRILPSGASALLVECADLTEVLALHDLLAASTPDGLVELVPGARTVLVAVDPDRLPLETAASWVRRKSRSMDASGAVEADAAGGMRADGSGGAGADGPGGAGAGAPGGAGADAAGGAGADAPGGTRADDRPVESRREPPPVVVPVVYDGADLAELAETLGVSTEAFVARHAGARWRVAFAGFAPGFAYLVSDDWPFDVPRLDSPRTRVPAGSVALAGVFSGAYPRESPGGWRLIGRTDAPLWNVDADPPALLAPRRRVRFEVWR